MKRLSIKAKVTIWYSGLLITLISILLIYVFASTTHVVMQTSKSNIKNIVKQSLSKIDYKNGRINIKNHFLYYNSGVSILVYNNGKLIFGNYPVGFLPEIPLTINKTQLIDSETDKWLIYDLKGNDGIVVRGISPLKLASQTLDIAIYHILIAMPFFIVVAGLGGYIITKKAFKPIEKIIKTVDGINSGNDLSKRIHLAKATGEVATLGNTFDNMFDRLEEAFEKEKHFTSDASHELRTPISVIISQCEYALDINNNPNETQHCLEVILDQSKMMSSFISQLLIFARADNSVKVVSLEQINLSELSEIIIEELLTTAKEKGVSIIPDIEEDIIINADQTLITRMLINLISNGINYSKENGLVRIRIFKINNYVKIIISDNGIGMDKKHLDKIWNRFYRIEASRSKNNTLGTGLGLPMVKLIVSLHNGEICVESKSQVGSKFTITLPLS